MRSLPSGIADALVTALRRERVPAWEARDDAPSTLVDVLRTWSERRRLVVWAGASHHTVWGAPACNHAFRAWHDYCHVLTGLGFSPADEIALGEWQAARCEGALLRRIVRAETAGQARHFAETGRYVVDQTAFTLEAVCTPTMRR